MRDRLVNSSCQDHREGARAPAAAAFPWSVDSWKQKLAAHEVVYEDRAAVDRAVSRIRELPPLVTSGEVERLRGLIAEAQRGERFLVQGGDCAERLIECRPGVVTGTLKILLQVSLVLLHASRRPVIRVGRWAGQYAKPRSSATETRTVDGARVTLPSYYGDLVNAEAFSDAARRPDPGRMVEGYAHAAMTLNFVRALIDGGFADIHHPEWWELGFLRRAGLPEERRGEYGRMLGGLLAWLREIEATERRQRGSAAGAEKKRLWVEELERVEFFASHEGLNLLYESAQTRMVPRRAGWYDLTTHLPWIGERTRGLDGAHVEFFRGVRNPLGIKIGPRVLEGEGLDELVRVLDVLNPADEPGRLVLITRLGADRVRDSLPRIVERVGGGERGGRNVLWVCDPMHGNTVRANGAASPRAAQHAQNGAAGGSGRHTGVKTRFFSDIVAEVEGAWDVLEAMGQRLGGIHIEVTGEDVTECIGGASGVTEDDLSRRYETACDPRLNYEQAMELAFVLGKRMAKPTPTNQRG